MPTKTRIDHRDDHTGYFVSFICISTWVNVHLNVLNVFFKGKRHLTNQESKCHIDLLILHNPDQYNTSIKE